MGAGVVPVALAPDGTYRVLLGRERFLPQWKGSCRWSGFEGSRKEGEGVRETALREFLEESLGVLADDVAHVVAHAAHWIRIVLRIRNVRRTGVERYHATYVVPVAWDAHAPKRFLKTRLALEHVDRAAQEWRYARPAALGEEYVGDVTPCADGAAHVSDVPERTWARMVAQGPPECVEGEAARGVLEWQRLRDRVERTLVAHPGVTARRCARGLLQSVHLNRDYMEKDQVRWWTLPELHQVLGAHGHLGHDRFRPYFLPVLQTLLQELAAAPPCVTRFPAAPAAVAAPPAAAPAAPGACARCAP